MVLSDQSTECRSGFIYCLTLIDWVLLVYNRARMVINRDRGVNGMALAVAYICGLECRRWA